MRHLSRFDIVIGVAVATSLVAGSLGDLPRILGAHPFWAQQTGVIGGIGGALLWLAQRRVGLSSSMQVITAIVALSLSATAAYFGKQVFAASFAENWIAGRFWYFGWFAVSGSVAFLLAATIAGALRR